MARTELSKLKSRVARLEVAMWMLVVSNGGVLLQGCTITDGDGRQLSIEAPAVEQALTNAVDRVLDDQLGR